MSFGKTKMQRSLFLLIVMGQCSLLTCQVFELHLIDEEEKWSDAQEYCREEYTDLATVPHQEFNKLLSQCAENKKAWIGLHWPTKNEHNGVWRWTGQGEESSINWAEGKPKEKQNGEDCALMNDNGELNDVKCSAKHKFICYDGTSQKKFHYIQKKEKWAEAQNFCRENHTDLVSGDKQLTEAKDEINPSESVWVGLFKDRWRWSDNTTYAYRNGTQFERPAEHPENCAMVTSSGIWDSAKCNEKKPFFCYRDNIVLIPKNLSWEDAIDHCRDHYGGLVSIHSLEDQLWVKEKAKQAQSRYIWLGLLDSCPLDMCFWINDRLLTYENWAKGGKKEGCYNAVAMDAEKDYQWVTVPDHETYNFICFRKALMM